MENTITQEHIDEILAKTEVQIMTVYDKCTVVMAKLPNGFVIVESSACVDKANYNEEMGTQICIERIINKVWELEGYKLQCEVSNKEEETVENVEEKKVEEE